MPVMPDGPDEPDEKMIAQLREQVEAFENDCRKIGIYLEGFVSGTAPQHPAGIEDDDPRLFVMATFLVGEQVFTDRVMRPERHEEDTQFRTAVGTIDPAEDIKAQMQKNLEEGRDAFDDGE